MSAVRPVTIALTALALLPAAAPAAEPPGGLGGSYECSEVFASYGPTGIPVWNRADRGVLEFHTDYDLASDTNFTTSYDYDAFFLEREARAGGWTWDGERALFDSGPLARPGAGWSVEARYYPHHRRMPHDTHTGRTYPVVLRSLIDAPAEEAPATAGREGEDGYQSTYWYCGRYGTAVRKAFGRGFLGYVAKRTGIEPRVPDWFVTGEQGRFGPSVLVMKRGYYRIALVEGDSEPGIFSAKRAPASDLGHRTRVKLGKGVVGWVGSYGCGFSGTPDWGPKYCGRPAIVWHQDGVNYCIEALSMEHSDLVRAARLAVRAAR